MGTIFGRAGGQKAYASWLRAVDRKSGKKGLTGNALETAVMGIASIFPENVTRVSA